MSEADESTVTLFQGDVRKADTKALITNGTDAFPEDSFEGTYWTGGTTGSGVAVIEPMYKPGTLHAIAAQNNILQPCIEAMEVNIDGTGHVVVLKAGEEEDEAERQRLEEFFAEPYPNKSIVEIRRALRRDVETTGNAYLEIIRNVNDEIVMMNVVDSADVRLLRLDDPVLVNRVVRRNGADLTVQIRTRERRFVQMVNGKKVYFKEYGSTRDLDRSTGEWNTNKKIRLPISKRASELIHFIGNREPKTPYGSPRWISQLPSVLGSRKAEEHNLEFFDGGGIPPVLVLVQGGTLGTRTKEDLRNHLSGQGSSHRAAIVEATSTSGSIDSSGSVQVRVERFGSERQNDSMFQDYDRKCEENVRGAFRLPPLFVGRSGDMNFATAYTAYMVAEAQVFSVEREEFDDVINTKLLRDMGVEKHEFRSLPMTLVDVQNQLRAIELASGKSLVSGEDTITALNEITGLSLEFDEASAKAAQQEEEVEEEASEEGEVKPDTSVQLTAQSTGTGAEPPYPTSKGERVAKLAAEWLNSLEAGVVRDDLRWQVSKMDEAETDSFNAIIAARMLGVAGNKELEDLCQCATDLMVTKDEA